MRYKQKMANERVIPSHCCYDQEIKVDKIESDQKEMGFAACSQMRSFRIRVEGRRKACIKRFEGRRQCILKSIEGKREACIKSIEGRWGRHTSSQALKKGGGRQASRALSFCHK